MEVSVLILTSNRSFFRKVEEVLPNINTSCTLNVLMTASRYSLNKTKYLLPPEVEHLLAVLDRFESKDPRNTLLIRLALKTGARAQEILYLKQADLNPYDETVFFRGLKNSNDREIPLSSSFFSDSLASASSSAWLSSCKCKTRNEELSSTSAVLW